MREADLTLNPTFVTFTPWTSLEGYLDLLTLVDALDLVDNVSPIQYAIRLLFEDVLAAVKAGQSRDETRREIFDTVWRLTCEACGASAHDRPKLLEVGGSPQTPIPHLSEPW